MARPLPCFHKSESHEETAQEKSEKLYRGRRFIVLTRDLTAVELEPQRDAVLPRLRSDSYEAGQDRLRDPIENNLRGISVGVENL